MTFVKPEVVVDFELDLGNLTEGHSAKIDPPTPLLSRAKVWKEAATLLSYVRYRTLHGYAEIRLDWKNISADALLNSAVNFGLYMKLLPCQAVMEIHDKHFAKGRTSKVGCCVSLFGASGLTKEAQQNGASYVVERFLYDLFLQMNLAAPGSCDLNGSRFRAKLDDYDHEITLNSWMLESCWNKSLDDGWPDISYVPLKDVLEWKESLEIGSRQIAKTRTERALFALLHVCKNGDYDPPTLLWLSHALEALFDTPVTLIGSFLQKRMIGFLEVPVDKQKLVKRHCRDFYDLRSSFAHGDMAIAHPLENETLDPAVDNYRDSLAKAIDFA